MKTFLDELAALCTKHDCHLFSCDNQLAASTDVETVFLRDTVFLDENGGKIEVIDRYEHKPR